MNMDPGTPRQLGVATEGQGDVLELPAASRTTAIALDELELVYAFIYARVGNRADAEDLTQQVAMKAIPRLRQGNVGAQFWSAYVPVETRKKGTAVRDTLEQVFLDVARGGETVARMEARERRNPGPRSPHSAEPVLGLAEGKTRGLHAGYAETEK